MRSRAAVERGTGPAREIAARDRAERRRPSPRERHVTGTTGIARLLRGKRSPADDTDGSSRDDAVQERGVGRRAVETAKTVFRRAPVPRLHTARRAPLDAHAISRAPSPLPPFAAMEARRLHPLFDVPGTGFRDREGTPMFAQYHKIGWQVSWRAEDSEENAHDLLRNPVVLTGLPRDVDVARVRDRLRDRFGAVARVHRPTRSGEPSRGVAFEEDEKAGDAGKRPAAPSRSSPSTFVGIADDADRRCAERRCSAEPSSEDTREELQRRLTDSSIVPPKRFSRTKTALRRSFLRSSRESAPRRTSRARRPDIRASFRDARKRAWGSNVGPSLLVKPTEA